MAGPQFITPQRVTPSRPSRRFTLDQANQTLPLVKRVVGDIVRAHQSAVHLQAQLEHLSSGKEQLAMQADLESTLDRLQDYLDELTDIGCELKDYQMGLIDFIGRHQGRDVYLCWKLGEEKITHWHEIQAGFAGRQPVSKLQEGE